MKNWLSLMLAAFLVVGCGAEDGESCEDDFDCESLACVGDMCVGSDCDEDSDCREGWLCGVDEGMIHDNEGQCAPPCNECPDHNRYWCEGPRCHFDPSPF